jgi:hypothetical protein
MAARRAIPREESSTALVVVLPFVKERVPQLAFAHGADFSKGAVATAVLDGHARFQPVRADGCEPLEPVDSRRRRCEA